MKAFSEYSNHNSIKETEILKTFINKISHDLRNPLSVVKSSAYLLKMLYDAGKTGVDNPKTLEQIRLIEKETDKALEIIASYLTFLNLSDPEIREISLEDIVKNSVNYLSGADRGIIQNSFSEKPFLLKADPGQLQTVIEHLINNAFFSLSGKGKIIIKADKFQEKNHAVIDVINNGQMIPEENRDKIFDAFFTTKINSAGIGLSVSREIIENHKGRIFLKDSNEKETVFRIELPLT